MEPIVQQSTEETKFEPGLLSLSNGMKFQGHPIGVNQFGKGELVFTTGVVGYTKTLTDPSYYGQIIVFTFPLMGNYGVPDRESETILKSGFESKKIWPAGVILSSISTETFHWRSKNTLDQWLKYEGIPGVSGVDTRQLAQLIRSSPNLTASIGQNNSLPVTNFLNELVLPEVSTKERKTIGKGSKKIGLVDCGVKWNIIRQLLSLDCEIEILPWDTDFKKVDCSGWLISNGPGDPQITGDLILRVKSLLNGNQPILGICLGYQLLALAAGAKTERLQYGHRGHNHSVQLIGTQTGYMTSQNHGYVVIEETLPKDWTPWFRHINDGTLEGIKHIEKPFLGVQFHPEAAAGPQDTAWIIEDFVKRLK